MIFRPMIIDSLEGYGRKQLFSDISAGFIVGIIAVPLCIGFAIATGVSPEKGLIAAFISSFLIAVLGGGRFQITGPTGAFAVILFSVMQRHGADGLATATLMAGIILLIMGLSGVGSVIRFIPYPVMAGFTSGVAVIIFSLQISDFLGLSIQSIPADFIGKWTAYIKGIPHLNWQAAALSGLCLVIMILWPKVNRKIPGALVAILISAAAVSFFGMNVETIGSRFGDIPSAFPVPVMPNFEYAFIRQLIFPAVSIAMLCAIEGLLSAAVADGMTGTKHRSDMELVAFGAANILSPMFGGIAATGAVARTAASIRNGARSPVAALVHAAVMLLVMLCLGQWIKLIPLAALASVLVMVAYGMNDWRKFAAMLTKPGRDMAVLGVTFILTILVNLTVAVICGVALAAIFYAFSRRTAITVSGDSQTKASSPNNADNTK
ncbi:MAG: hypothetical protein LBI42_12730 [Chitinispirillales bacterium]|jgi:SulP family sulfate permease|nr:hypothetical protein [Chitinispirillales bacterium]